MLAANGITLETPLEAVFAPTNGGRELPISNDDFFLSTSWWTTRALLSSVRRDRLAYLLQEDERMFYPHGDDRVRCEQAMCEPGLAVVVNSQLLFDHLADGPEPIPDLAERGAWFEPAFPAAGRTVAPPDASGRRKLFFDARPNNLRNLFLTGIEAISNAIADGTLHPAEWDIHLVGKDVPDLLFPRGVRPQRIEGLTWNDYHSLVASMDAGIVLMDTPHPSYPPLDLAAHGAAVLTNVHGLKTDLSYYSRNILLEEPDMPSLARGISRLAALARDPAARSVNLRNDQICRDWTVSLAGVVERLADVDTLVLARVRYDADVARLITAAKSQGVRILFDCDDLVFDTRYVHLLLDTLDQDTKPAAAWDGWFASIGRIEATARLCDGAITTNRFLAEQLAETVPGPVCIVPNFLNRRQQEVSETLLAVKRARGFAGEGPVTIGYFSGTPTHNHDFAIVTPALARLLDRDPDVRVRIVGFMEAIGPLAAHAERLECIPLHDWINLQRLIAEVEINIAPLQENVFTNCKSELKFFEAAIVGTWTLATPTMPFKWAIRSADMGRLTRAEDWDRALAEAVMLVRCPARYAPIAEANAAAVRDAYGWDRFADRILEATVRND